MDEDKKDTINEKENLENTEEIIKKENGKEKIQEQKESEEVKENEVKISKEKENNKLNKDKKKEPKKEKSKKKSSILVISITLVLCLAIFMSVIFALLNINNEKIMSGVYINDIDISDLTKDEARKKLEDITKEKLEEEMNLKYGEYETTINGTQINAKYDIDNAINQAYNIGRDGNIVVNNYNILWAKLFNTEITLQLYYDEEKLDTKIQDISSKIPGALVENSYYIEDDELIIVRGKKGIQIIKEDLKENIIEKINNISQKYEITEIPVQESEPGEIDLKKIRDEIFKEPKDAYVSKDPITVHTHVNGVDFKISLEKAQNLIKENKKEYKIPLKITVPKKTISNLGKEAFPNELAKYTTRYDVTNYNRSNNLSIAADKIDGTVIMPGETFSYNQVVGARTIAAGYKEAGAFAGGQVIQSVGGGICQVSSTLYNAALLANLEITDRSNHVFLTGYVAAGRDATVSWGTIDFKFKNTRKYPIKIEASAKNGICKMAIYGIEEETEYEVVIQSKVLSYIPYTTKYIEDDTLEQGKEKVEQSGQNGCTSEAYRILKLDGKVISKTLLSKDTYDPMQRIVKKGTKKKVEETVTQPVQSNETENNVESNDIVNNV